MLQATLLQGEPLYLTPQGMYQLFVGFSLPATLLGELKGCDRNPSIFYRVTFHFGIVAPVRKVFPVLFVQFLVENRAFVFAIPTIFHVLPCTFHEQYMV